MRDHYPIPAEARPYGWKLTARALTHRLIPVGRTIAERTHPPVPNAKERFLAANPGYLEEEGYQSTEEFEWERFWVDIPSDLILRTFTLDECCRLYTNGGWSDLYERFDKDPEYMLFWKITHALRMWGRGFGPREIEEDYNQFVRVYTALSKFDFGLGPDFEVRLNHTNSTSERGSNFFTVESRVKGLSMDEQYALFKQYNVWIDREFGYFILYKGQHVLTIGFSPTNQGVLINQVQLRQKKGNRWLYHLPEGKHYLDYVLARMAEAFKDCGPLWLVDGATAAEQVVRVHPKKDPVPAEVLARIAAFYNRPLCQFERTTDTHSAFHLTFYRLNDTQPVPSRAQAA